MARKHVKKTVTPPPPVEKPQAEKPKHGRVFSCEAHGLKDMDAEALKAHLATDHGITVLKGMKKMTSHLDGRDYFSSVYEWTFKAADGSDVIIIESTWAERAKDDPMRFV